MSRSDTGLATTSVRHGPFLAFLSAVTVACAWAQIHVALLAPFVPQIYLFLQIALGATVIAALRHVIGVRTYGTFAAVMIAASFLPLGPVLGFLLYGLVLGVLVGARAAIGPERIQEAHRIAILVILAGFAALIASIVGFYVRQPVFAAAFLFPMLITAWIAERFVESKSQRGRAAPLKALGGTTLAIAVAYAVMVQSWLVLPFVENPITWAGLVVLNWWIGTRLRFRLSERWRFRPSIAPDDAIPHDDILTMTVRNREYIARYNSPELLASFDKVRAKQVLASAGIPMPRTHAILRAAAHVPQLADLLPTLGPFALKPASAYGGEGITLVHGRVGPRYLVDGSSLALRDLLQRAAGIVRGEYSDGLHDTAIVEELLEQDPALSPLAPEGVVDIRVLCFLGFPVMAMARLPTRASGGRGNLHAGAVGVGIRLASGRLGGGIHRGRWVHVHPDTGVPFRSHAIPRWREVLELAVEAQKASGLGFAGVDIVLDRRQGPVVLEVNRRPGLEIQNANRSGLLPRLRAFERLPRIERESTVAVDMAVRFEDGAWGRLPVGQRPPPAAGVPARAG